MKSTFRLILSFTQPINLLLAGLSYLLGLSVGRYLGITLQVIDALLGCSLVLFILASSSLLNAYFATPFGLVTVVEPQHEREILRRWLLYTSVGTLAISVVIVFLFILSKSFTVPVVLFLALDVLLALSISIPPFRLNDRGFGELVLSILLAGFPAIIAFLLQTNNLHRLVAYITFPLALLTLAYLLILDFPGYSSDQKFGHQSLLIRLTWQRAVPLHNLLIFVSYLFFAAAPLVGIPYALIWSPLLTLPLAIYQIVMLRNITMGLKPNWIILTINATALVGLTTYLLMLTFWLR
jgi:1,4-dihydroxy-2-naphthoate octaprenyltransferase